MSYPRFVARASEIISCIGIFWCLVCGVSLMLASRHSWEVLVAAGHYDGIAWRVLAIASIIAAAGAQGIVLWMRADAQRQLLADAGTVKS